MSVVLHLFTITIVNISILNVAISKHSDVESVISVNVLFRHGQITLESTYPTDPYQRPELWTEGRGQLTSDGKRQQFELGQWLRRRYDHLLTDTYSPEMIHVRSTDVDRTLMSAQCNMAGMFIPREPEQIWNKKLAWQPIPVHTMPAKMDNMLSNDLPICSAYHSELQDVLNSDITVKELNYKYNKLYKILNNYTTKGNITNLFGIHWIYDILSTERSHHLPLPLWAEEIYPEPLRTAATYGITLETFTKKLARLRSGLVIKDMISNMVEKKNNLTNRRMNVYSAHDRTLTNIMHSLGAFNFIIPPYAACLMMELRIHPSGDFYVTLFYRNSTLVEPYPLTIEGCSAECPLEKFITLCDPLIPKDWKEECKTSYFSTRGSVVPLVFIATLGALVILCICISCCRRMSTANI